MIEVNLIPGGKKRSPKKGRGGGKGISFSLPGLKGPLSDRWVLGASVVWVLALAGAGWVYWTLSAQTEEVDVAVAAQVQDSARFAELISQVQSLIARRDSIIQRVDIIQTIDQDRYVWPHVLDEISRALPDYTWLTAVIQASPPPDLQVTINGQAGNNFAVAQFMTNLTDSPFIRVADLVTSSQTIETSPEGIQQLVYSFTLEVYFQPPPPEILETVPLFDEGEAPPALPGS